MYEACIFSVVCNPISKKCRTGGCVLDLLRQEAVAFGEWGLGSVALAAFVQDLSCRIKKEIAGEINA